MYILVRRLGFAELLSAVKADSAEKQNIKSLNVIASTLKDFFDGWAAPARPLADPEAPLARPSHENLNLSDTEPA